MDVRNDSEKFSRNPTLEDLITLCKHLNEDNVKYIIIGGFGIIHYGYVRGTADIDLLVDSSKENAEKIKKALLYLPDQAVKDMNPTDIVDYTVVRIADEIVIDLLEKACEVTYEDAQQHIEYDEINGVKIPYLKANMLIKTKQSIRPKDIDDRNYLEYILKLSEKVTIQPQMHRDTEVF